MATNPRLKTNNFDLIRLLLAGIVCMVHAAELSGQKSLYFLGDIFSSKLAVDSFFTISGFLIFMSYEKSSSLRSYAEKRIKRIYPAYLTIVMLCAFALFAISSASFSQYFSLAWIKFLLANLTFMNFIQPALPGVFTGQELDTVNGALWTIKIEVMFYIAVPIIVWMTRRLPRPPVLIALYVLSTLWSVFFTHLYETHHSEAFAFLEKQLPGQLRYFIAGGLVYYYLETFQRHVKWLVPVSLAVYVASIWLPLKAVEPLVLAVLVAFCALYCYLGNFGKFGDFSYGTYICHFPIIQTLTYFGLFAFNPFLGLATAVCLTLLAAILMWHLVEKRFLARNNHYVRAEAHTSTAPAPH
ncbi:MAG: hypothetical protein GAK45_01448 [Pseudomonas citronellolis]|nr:MAG: hypothetical protein GAK45_01448 [Pseudomonas citronellolis]